MLYTSFTKQKTSLNPTKMFALETSVFISRHYDYTQSSKHVMFLCLGKWLRVNQNRAYSWW